MSPNENSVADLVFVDGPVYTVDAARTWARGVAVRDGRIVAVGADDAVRPLVGPSTEIVDLRGRMLLPGFQDAHVHPVFGGLDRLQCDLHDLATEAEYVDAIARYAEEHPIATGSSAAGGRWTSSRGHAHEGTARCRRPRSTRLPAQP